MSSSGVQVSISTFATAAIEARASPLKPRVPMESRSFSSAILLVAWLLKAFLMSSRAMPQPLSVTRIYVTPPRFISTVSEVAPASIEFSISSFMTDAGLSTTSPAAIRSAICLGNTLIFGINFLSLSLQGHRGTASPLWESVCLHRFP